MSNKAGGSGTPMDESSGRDLVCSEVQSEVALIESLIEDEKCEQALQLLQAAILRDARSATLQNLMGAVLAASGRPDEAQTAFDEAIALAPMDAKYHYDAGGNYLERREFEAAEKCFARVIELDPGYVDAHAQLGAVYEECGSEQDAVREYQKAIRLSPRSITAHQRLARLLVRNEQYDEAVVCFENVLRISPDDMEAYKELGEIFIEKRQDSLAMDYLNRAVELGSKSSAHFLAALRGELPPTPPAGYVEELFDEYVEEFEEHLTEDLDYDAPRQLIAAIRDVAGENAHFNHAVDLGCGTGLAGPLLKPMVNALWGVDLSNGMLQVAEQKQVYDKLQHSDLVRFLDTHDSEFDLFFSADVLIYLGPLDTVFEAVAGRAGRGALFSFSVELFKEEGYTLTRSGRYAHSVEYTRQVAQRAGFEVLETRYANLRKEHDEWVAGVIWVLRKR
jgi:predicted TPR repeat methyltransferase